MLLDHSLTLNSVEGRGCNFAVEVTTSAKQIGGTESPQDNAVISLQGITVLCVENDPNLLAAMVALLETWNCHILACDNSDQAYGYAMEYADEIDVMLMDYQLSEEITGLALMQALNKASDYGIPGVLITATADSDLPMRAAQAGFEFMKKPMKPAALRALISAMLTQKMQRDYSLLDENEVDPTSN